MSIPIKQRERQPHTHSVGRETVYRGIVYRYIEKGKSDSQKKILKISPILDKKVENPLVKL